MVVPDKGIVNIFDEDMARKQAPVIECLLDHRYSDQCTSEKAFFSVVIAVFIDDLLDFGWCDKS